MILDIGFINSLFKLQRKYRSFFCCAMLMYLVSVNMQKTFENIVAYLNDAPHDDNVIVSLIIAIFF